MSGSATNVLSWHAPQEELKAALSEKKQVAAKAAAAAAAAVEERASLVAEVKRLQAAAVDSAGDQATSAATTTNGSQLPQQARLAQARAGECLEGPQGCDDRPPMQSCAMSGVLRGRYSRLS